MFEEIAFNEYRHVRFIRETLLSLGVEPVARPEVDLFNSFNAIAQAAGLGPSFDPFANQTNFALAAENFESVGVTAYAGASPLLTNKQVILGSARILAIEAYHSGILRLLEYQSGSFAQTASDDIAALRTKLDGNPANVDQGVLVGGHPNLTPTDPNGLALSRTTREVLDIDYGAPYAAKGGFFPNGLNGVIKSCWG